MGRVNEDELDWSTLEAGRTVFRRKKLGDAADGEKLGCTLYEIPPGNRSWPYHYHTENEEAIFVLEGTGTLRDIDGMTPLTKGDYVAFPADERGAHRVINDSEDPLRFLMVSTMSEPDITVYPDSDKFGVFAGSPPGGTEERNLYGYYQRDSSVNYWHGEEEIESE